MLQSPRLKDHVQTIGIDPSWRNNSLYEHKCLQNIMKLYKHAGRCDYQQLFKDILEAAMVSNPEGFNDDIPIYPTTLTPLKKPSDRKSLCLFTNTSQETKCYKITVSFHYQDNADVAHKEVNIYCETNQFPALPFCGLHPNPHLSRGLINNYHLRFDPKLGHGICAICHIPRACVACTSMIYKPWISGIPKKTSTLSTCHQLYLLDGSGIIWQLEYHWNNTKINTFWGVWWDKSGCSWRDQW